MNISYRWLRALVPDLADTPQELADRLGMLGAPVDEWVEIGAELGDLVIARVDEVRPHPNADRLRLCTVDAGGGAPLQVVCGAPNVEAGGYYPFAPVGARLPGGVEIRKAKIRGEPSEGMLCSARELGLGRDHAGLLGLSGEWEPGAPFVDRLGLDDVRLLVDITPNRPDLLSHLGVAREVAPGGAGSIRLPPFPDAPAQSLRIVAGEREAAMEGVRVVVEDVEGCPRYMAAIVRGVRVAPSPEWLATRLRAIGVRPINNVVDATNYVLMELGQPLHAFDLRLLGGEIRVRPAASGETLRTLDDVERSLDPGMLVIADARTPVAVAGVMGGAATEVSATTSDLLIECALFDERDVRRTARSLGLSTDASYRFERGVDPDLQPRALQRVVSLVLAVAGGEAAPAALDVRSRPFTPAVVALRPARVSKLLGVEMTGEEIAPLLHGIGFTVDDDADGALRVRVPGHRPDVTREIDLVEEVARRRGYHSFPEALPAFRPSSVPEDAAVALEQRLHRRFSRWGFHEARTAAFAPGSPERVPLLNPLSSEESHLRDRLAPGLLRRVEHNWAHGVRDVRLYEMGSVFRPGGPDGAVHEARHLAAVFTGTRLPPHWQEEALPWDVWDARALLAELAEPLAAGGVAPGWEEDFAGVTAPAERLALPGKGGELVGGGGRVTAACIDAPAWAGPVWVVEVRLPATPPPRPAVVYAPLPEHPASERDLALLAPLDVPAGRVEEVIRGAAATLLEAVWPFDLYVGTGIPDGMRSVAWRLRFRAPDRTLTDAEVDLAVQDVLSALDAQLGVRRR